ncbi:MAG: Stp1/IreP family PP2C-type Ser/Thr phosphatase [Nitrospirae bacterium]|nr:Stp1/IreP family PP2C-type Ser/Thr phosphatase [Candidatus Manganitrophaceae bacterium]
MKVTAAGLTDVGRVRRSNEDSLGLFPEFNLYVVADGMGGHAAGEVASRIAVQSIQEFFSSPEITEQTAEMKLARAIGYANEKIYEAGEKDSSLSGMGTTVVAVVAHPTETIIGYVGDSRVYLFQEDKTRQLTQDHSLVNEYVRKGLLTAEAAQHHPLKHVISRALGTSPRVDVETLRQASVPRNILLLCSDGLSNKLTLEEINTILTTMNDNLEKACRALVERAKEKGGEDNITVVLIGYQ